MTVMDHNNLTEHTEIGCAKLPLIDIPTQVYDGTFDIYDKNAHKVGVVVLSLRLEPVALPFGASVFTSATPMVKPTPVSPSVHAPVASSNGSLYPQQQYKQQLQQQHQQHRQGAGFSSIAAPSSPNMAPQAFYPQQAQEQRQHQQQEQEQQAFSSPTIYAPKPVTMGLPVQPSYYPSSNNGPTPCLFATAVAPYSSFTPQEHQEQLDDDLHHDSSQRLMYASTPSRPFTPVPDDHMLSSAPYHGSYRRAQPQHQQQHVSSPVPMPQRVEGASSSYSTYTPTSNENGQIRVEEEGENDGNALPPNWEERTMPDGRVFYLNHAFKVTTWTRPLAMGVVPPYTA